jgi:TonB family protein
MELLLYLIKINTAVCIFYIMYKLFYRNDTFFSMRRYLMQGMLILSMVYPFVDFSQWMTQSQAFTDIAVSYAHILPAATHSPVPTISAAPPLPAEACIGYFYLLITGLLLLRLLFRTMRIVWLRVRSRTVVVENVRVFRLNKETMPFSFFSWIFMNPDLHDRKDAHEILTHETVHVRQHHSIDVLVAEIVCAFCWINPAVWMLRKEIGINLEFITDRLVVKKVDIDMKSYQYHLLKLSHQPHKNSIINQFNVSLLKERIMMLNVKKSSKVKLVAYTLVIPLTLLLLIANNADAVADKMNVAQSADPKVISGIVLDGETKEPLQGVHVLIEGTTAGTVSGAEGRFTIEANKGEKLFFSHIGYSTKELNVSDLPENAGTIELSRQPVALSDVVVIAYGTAKKPPINGEAKDMVFTVAEKMPEFPGGEQALLKHIAEHILYPVAAAEKGQQGQVLCKFVIREDGVVGNVTVIKGVAPALDNEAIRVLYSLPRWIPGRQHDRAVAVEYTLPVTFRIQK